MFNESQKQRFLEYASGKYSTDNITNIISLFNKVESYERKLDKDVSCFNREDISNMYSMFRYSSPYVYSSVNSKLNAYTEWCASQLLIPDGCNHFKEFVFTDLEKYVNERIQRNRYLNIEEFDVFVERTANPRDQFLLLCLWEIGKSENFAEIFQMKLEDIDEEAGTVQLVTGRTAKVSKRLINKAKEADETLLYYQGLNNDIERKLAPGEYIFKRVRSSLNPSDPEKIAFQNIKMVARIVKNLVDKNGVNKGINAATIALSGQIYMIRKRSAELGISKRDYIMNYFDELHEQYGVLIPDNPHRYYKKNEAYL